jgi:hypothetical protein
LIDVESLCERIVFERRGRVKITLLADHGHNMFENRRATFAELLRKHGYRPTNRLRKDRDVVVIEYGLVTYADFYTSDPVGVGTCILTDPRVEFVCYPDQDAVVVRNEDGLARIRRGDGGYYYDASGGDPLKLAPILERLKAEGGLTTNGEIIDQALFVATIHHEYPDPLRRLWEAFHGLVDQPPDLIANLRDGTYHGNGFFAAVMGRVASTHGALNSVNTTTFAMTMLGELPPAMRSVEVLPALRRLRTGAAEEDVSAH